jgi:PAS domain S-box-containing protein
MKKNKFRAGLKNNHRITQPARWKLNITVNIIIFLLFILFLPFHPAFAAESRVVKVLAYEDYPLIFKDKKGNIDGFYVDLLKEISQEENIRFEYVYGTWQEGLGRLAAGEVDLVTGIVFSQERAKVMDFGRTSLLTFWGELYVLQSSEINGLLSVKNKKIGVLKGDINAINFQKLTKQFALNCQFIEFANYEDVFKAVADKKVDAAVSGGTFGEARHREYSMKSTGVVFNPFDLYFAVPKGKNQNLLQLMDRHIHEGKRQGNSVFNNAKQKWLLGSLGTVAFVPDWLISALIILGVVFALALAFIILLNLRVKTATKAVQESEDRYKKAFHINQDSIAINRLHDGMYILVNEGFTKITGYTEADIAGKTSFDINIWESRAERDRIVECLKHDGKAENFEAHFLKKDGSIISGLMSSTILNIDGIPHNFSVTKDITNQKKAEEALRESEELFRTSLERAPDGVYMNDLEGNFLYGNRKAEELIGYKREELIGRNFLDLNLIAEGSLAKAAELLGENIEGRSTGPDEVEMVSKNGSKILIEINTNVIQRGGKKNVLAFVRDITSRKQAAQEKRDLQERLNRAEKMEALGTLAGGVAHDLNNILGIVVGYSEMILDEVEETSPLRRKMVNIFSSGQKAAAVVDDLLAMARRGVPGSSILNLNDIIDDCQQSPELAKLSSYHRNVKIITDLDVDLLNIAGSPVHLSKSLYNLISNASEAMSKGGILTIKTANQYLDKPMSGYDEIKEGDYVVLSVSDTGEGISEKDRKRIFEPFYTKKIMGRSGTGLGLAVVWGTVTDHKGYINVQSVEGKGSTFTMYFPVTREEVHDNTMVMDVSEYMGNGQSILLVDDVAIQRELATDMLKKLNYNVESVQSGEEALLYLKDHKTDLVILDMIMDPGMDGLDTYRSILEINPQQKTIIVSGFSETHRVDAAQGLGAGAYVKKPYIKEKLGLAVKKELGSKR